MDKISLAAWAQGQLTKVINGEITFESAVALFNSVVDRIERVESLSKVQEKVLILQQEIGAIVASNPVPIPVPAPEPEPEPA